MNITNTNGSLNEKLPFTVMVKPVGSLCNMRCDYCYYLDTEYENGASSQRMSDERLELFIRKYIEASPGPVIAFTWHGGEPAAAGVDFYRRVIQLEQKYLPEGFSCTNNLQTNGTLLDEDFCRFLAEHHFDVGLSIDGTRSVHDHNRHMADGSPSYGLVLSAAKRLIAHGIRPDLLCTVNQQTLSQAREVYRALRDLDTGWIQFIPIVNKTENGGVSQDSVTPEAYGEFLKDVFAEWFFHDLGRTNVQLFAETAKTLAGGEASLCTLAEMCGSVLVVEHDGGIYACDHFVDHAHYRGNLETIDFQAVLNTKAQVDFGRSKRDGLTRECWKCPYLSLCRGGCLKDRFGISSDGEAGHPYLCQGFRSFYSYAVPRLKRAMELSSRHMAGPAIQQQLIREERAAYARIGRNDPCPCGSGRKFKACCARRLP